MQSELLMESRDLLPSPGVIATPVRAGTRTVVLLGALALGMVLGTSVVGCGTDDAGLTDAGFRPPNVDLPDTGEDPEPPPPDAGEPDSDSPAPPRDAGPERPSGISCNFGRVTAKRAVPDVLLVFDRTSAMRKTVTGSMETRWNEMSNGIDEALKTSQSVVQWGLKFFPTTMGCEVAEGFDVAMAPSNYNAVIMRIRGTMPAMGVEGSPLHQAIKKATVALMARPRGNPRFMALVTDGVPNCPAGFFGERDAEYAVKMAGDVGIRTFVLGTAAPGTPAHLTLNKLAVAGLEPAATDTRYRPVQTKLQMLQALEEITANLTNCVLTVPDPGPPEPEFVALEIDGMRVKRDDTQKEGWTWNSGGTKNAAHIYGAACTKLRNSPTAVVQLIYGCQNILPP
jgi:hypothetical protein